MTPKMSSKPPRFNPWIDFHNSKKPDPATYAIKTSATTKKPRAYVKQQAVRMKANRYDTDAPGPGAYRVQSEFGIYSPDDINNIVS